MKLPSKAELAIPVDRLHDWFTYDPATGSLKWKVRKWTDFPKHRDWFMFCKRFACKEAGSLCNHGGYTQVRIFGRLFVVHRVIWAMRTGTWPAFMIDHIDHNGGNNCWTNLRAAPGDVNHKNMSRSRRNTSGVTGVHYVGSENRWRAQVQLNKCVVFQKRFPTKAEAISAVLAAREFHGFHPNHGQLNS